MAKVQALRHEVKVKIADRHFEFLENRVRELGLTSKAELLRWYIVNDMIKAEQQAKKELLSLKGIFKGGGPIPEEDIDEVNADASRLNIPKKRIEDYTKADWARLDREIKKWEEQRTERLIVKWREARKSKQKLEFENRVGVDLYNLLDESAALVTLIKRLSTGDSIELEDEYKKLKNIEKFYFEYHKGPDLLESIIGTIPDAITEEELTDKMKQPYERFIAKVHSEYVTFLVVLPGKLNQYRTLIDKAINGQWPTEEEIQSIQAELRRHTSIVWVNNNGGAIQEVPSTGLDSIFGHAYRFLCRLWSGEVKAGICAATDCGKLYIPTPRGRNQQYCSDACQKREYRRRLKTIEVSSASL